MGGELAYDGEDSPILGTDYQSDDIFERKGTKWSATAHIITGVIGAGVLSLSWSVAQLGWIAGPISILLFAAVTIVSSELVCDLYRFPDPETGHGRLPSYTQAVRFYLGDAWQYVSGALLHSIFIGSAIAYTIASAISLRAQSSSCIASTTLDQLKLWRYQHARL